MSRNILILIGLAVLLGGGYLYFFSSPSETLPLTASAPADPAEQKFLDLASKIGAISFEQSIFSDKRFLSLRSLETPILPEAIGRIDPFAPLGH